MANNYNSMVRDLTGKASGWVSDAMEDISYTASRNADMEVAMGATLASGADELAKKASESISNAMEMNSYVALSNADMEVAIGAKFNEEFDIKESYTNQIVDIIQKPIEALSAASQIAENTVLKEFFNDPFLDEIKLFKALKDLTTAETTDDFVKAIANTAKAIVKTLEKEGTIAKNSVLSDIAPLVDIFNGWNTYNDAFYNLFQKDQKPHEYVGLVFEAASGILNYASGFLKFNPATAPLSIIAKVSSAFLSIAADKFKNKNIMGGILTLLVGAIVDTGIYIVMKPALKAAFKALMETIRMAFNLTASPLAVNPLTSIAGIAIIGLISTLFAQALSNLFAQGGFPAKGQAFIAREAGPELVGTLNGRNAVVNNNQIVEAVSCGVYGAFMSAMCNKKSEASIRARVFLDGKQIAMA